MRHDYDDDLITRCDSESDPEPAWKALMDKGEEEGVIALFEAERWLIYASDKQRQFPLHVAAAKRFEKVFYYLLENHALLNEEDASYLTPLEHAIMHEDTQWRGEAVKALVSHGATMRGANRHPGEFGSDPLGMAIRWGRIDVLHLFRDMGDPLTTTFQGKVRFDAALIVIESHADFYLQLHERNLVSFEVLHESLLEWKDTVIKAHMMHSLDYLDNRIASLVAAEEQRVLQGRTECAPTHPRPRF